jgi:hypothetical protein
VPAVIKLRRARAGMVRHQRRVFERTATALVCPAPLLRNTRACARGHPRSAMPDRKLVMPSSWAYVPPRSVAGRIAQIACGKATK